MIDTAEHCILKVILVHMTLTLIQGDRDVRKQQMYTKYLAKVLNVFGWNLVCH